MAMLEQIVERRSWEVVRGLVQYGHSRLCHERDETDETSCCWSQGSGKQRVLAKT